MKPYLCVLNFLLLQLCFSNFAISQENFITTNATIINAVNCNEILSFASTVLDSSSGLSNVINYFRTSQIYWQ